MPNAGNVFFRHLDILTTGTTTVSDQSTANTDIIFAGTSSSNEPTLQFMPPAAFNPSPDENLVYSVRSLTAAGVPWLGFGPAYGAVNLGFETTLNVTNGIYISDGELSFTQGIGSNVTLDGNSIIDNGGTVTDAGGGRQGGTSINVNGTVIVGPDGANVFDPGVTEVNGPGVIRELGKNDVVSVGAVGNNFRIDDRAGAFSSFSNIANFSGTIGPAAGSNAPSLGPNATVNLSLLNNTAATVMAADFNTATGMLSLLDASGGDVADFHFTGNPRGLNLSVQNYGLVVTDHPGTSSAIPITFTS